MPDWRPLKDYDENAHAERMRKLLARAVATLPLAALVTLYQAAALLEAGEPLDVLVARERLGKRRGRAQVQQRENLDRGMRGEAAVTAENRALEEEARAEVIAHVPAWARRIAPQLTKSGESPIKSKAPLPPKR